MQHDPPHFVLDRRHSAPKSCFRKPSAASRLTAGVLEVTVSACLDARSPSASFSSSGPARTRSMGPLWRSPTQSTPCPGATCSRRTTPNSQRTSAGSRRPCESARSVLPRRLGSGAGARAGTRTGRVGRSTVGTRVRFWPLRRVSLGYRTSATAPAWSVSPSATTPNWAEWRLAATFAGTSSWMLLSRREARHGCAMGDWSRWIRIADNIV